MKASTRQGVLDTVARLGFRPNRAARALRGGPIQSVTVLTANTRLYGFVAALEGIEEAARGAGFAVGVRVVESGTPEAVRDVAEQAVELAEALIVLAFEEKAIAFLKAVAPDLPVAAIVQKPTGDEGWGQPWVWLDDGKAASEATDYLLGLGHKTVHFVSIPVMTYSNPRLAGWRSALENAGAPAPEPLHGTWELKSGFEAGQKLAADPSVTAVLCGNDDLAIGVIQAMRQAGRAVPDSVSVVGFDDMPIAEYFNPALTTVRQDFVALGRLCFYKLLAMLRNDASADAMPWPQAELIVRDSAGPPPMSSPHPVVARRRPQLRATTTVSARRGGEQ